LISKLRNILNEANVGLNWLEALPRALYVWHHTPGVTGFSPNQCDLTATGPEPEADPEAGRDDLVPSMDMVVPSLVVAECD
jgi:hypothetical protein